MIALSAVRIASVAAAERMELDSQAVELRAAALVVQEAQRPAVVRLEAVSSGRYCARRCVSLPAVSGVSKTS